MNIRIEMNEDDLKRLVIREIAQQTSHTVDVTHLQILVKSKQNYKSEWEIAAFRAVYDEG